MCAKEIFWKTTTKRIWPRYSNKNFNEPIQKIQNTDSPQLENLFNFNFQSEQVPETEFQGFGNMNFNEDFLQLPEQQLLELFYPLIIEQSERILQKLNNNEQITEQQILGLLNFMPFLADLQPNFEDLSGLLQTNKIPPQLLEALQKNVPQLYEEVQSNIKNFN
jgi:hypothetical protein